MSGKHRDAQMACDHVFVFYEQDLLPPLDDPRDETNGPGLRRVRRSVGSVPASRSPRPRRAPQRARAAARHARLADERPELHESLVVVTRTACRHEHLRDLSQPGERARRLRVEPEAEQPAEDADDVTVHDRGPNSEGNRRHRRARVCADAGQIVPAFERQRERAARRDHPRAAVEIARARVIAEAAPLRENRSLGRPGERLHRRETSQEARPAFLDDLDSRLLQHDLGDPDRVGIPGPPPRQVAARPPVPAREMPRDGASWEGVRSHGDTIPARWSSTGKALRWRSPPARR